MSIRIIIEIIDLLLWIIIAGNVFYVLFFALASLLPKKKKTLQSSISHQPSFLVLFPAYHEDAVITHSIESFLHQGYPKELFHVAVISDNMSEETNQHLASLPITLLCPNFEKSSKAKALQHAISSISQHTSSAYDYVVVLDATILQLLMASARKSTTASSVKATTASACHLPSSAQACALTIIGFVPTSANSILLSKIENLRLCS